MKQIYGICAAVILLTACVPKKSSENDKAFLKVVTTTGMIADAAMEIGGEHIGVTPLMGPGVDPHLYKASAGDVQHLQKADLILYNGLHLESRLGEVLENMGDQRPVHAVAESVPENRLITDESFGGSHDPHLWFDVELWSGVVQAVAQAIIDADPEREADYQVNLESYLAELDQLDREIRERLSKVPEQQRVLITAHDAFGYFGRAYGFEVKGLQGISTVAETGAKDVQELADYIASARIPAVFIESSVPRRSIEALQAAVQDRGFDVSIGGELFSDAMGETGTEEGTYTGMIRHNIDTIASALEES